MESLPSEDISGLLIIFGCLITSAFFSAAETAITSLSTLKVKHLLESRGKAVHHMTLWLRYPRRVITTILIFNNVVNILASAVATEMATRHFQNQAIGIATGVTTFLVLIFGEVVPKSFAKVHFETFGIFAMRVIKVIYHISFPAVWLLSEFASWSIRVVGGERQEGPAITEEELEFLVDVGQRSGAIVDFKKDMIDGVFEFDETKVREIMTPRTDVTAIDMHQTVREAVKLTIETGYSRIPVYDATIDNIVGSILAKDLLRFYVSGGDSVSETKVKKLMREAFFVPESKMIVEVFRDLKRTKNHMAIVIDEYGGTAGLVTMEDIIEEIVGEIQDEYDVEEAKILEIDSGVFDVSGSVNIDEFIDFFKIDDPEVTTEREQDIDTIAGWLTQHLGDMPKVGQTAPIGHLAVEISEVERHRIQRIRVTVQERDKVSEIHEDQSDTRSG